MPRDPHLFGPGQGKGSDIFKSVSSERTMQLGLRSAAPGHSWLCSVLPLEALQALQVTGIA